MAKFDFSSPSVLFLGAGSKAAMAGLALCLAATVMPAQAQMPPGAPALVRVAAAPASPGTALERGGLTAQGMALRTARLQAQEARQKEAAAAFAEAAGRLAAQPGGGSCFRGFLSESPQRKSIEESTVMLVARTASGATVGMGSGFVVRDSKTADSGRNRIVTANHVVTATNYDMVSAFADDFVTKSLALHRDMTSEDALQVDLREFYPKMDRDTVRHVAGDMLDLATLSEARKEALRQTLELPAVSYYEAYDSNGSFLGRVEVVARGAEGRVEVKDAATGAATATPDDWAVLRLDMRHTPTASAAAFDRIQGMTLAPVQATAKTHGMSGDAAHPASSPGSSGGPLVDNAGLVHGITSAVDTPAGVLHATISGLISPLDLNSNHGSFKLSAGSTELFGRQPLVANPLGDPRLLAAIGKAGIGVYRSPSAAMAADARLTAVGMPSGYCAAAPTVQTAMGMPMPDTRLLSASSETPKPLEVRVAKDGTRMQYDIDGMIAHVARPDGTSKSFEHGILVSQTNLDGSYMEFEGGLPVMLQTPDGTRYGYENGKAVVMVDAHGHEAPVPGVTQASAR